MTSLRSNLSPSLLAIVLVTATWACGDNYQPLEDDGQNDNQGTLTACQKLASPSGEISTYPALYEGTLALSSASLAVEGGQCVSENAPFGVETPGPETVISLSDLTPGAEYVVRLFSGSDLAMYVVTGCDEDAQAADGCLMFSDGVVQPPERGAFVAPASGEASLVIDYFLAAAPVVSEFSLDVYEAECSEDAECTDSGSRCVDARCVACATSFDCTNPSTPICDSRTNTCVAGDDVCNGDDDSEGFDDGPAGATDVTPIAGESESKTANGNICNSPATEVDFFSFTAAAGESFIIDLAWSDTSLDMDFGIWNGEGRQIGASLWRNPETIEVTFLEAGTYYAVVNLFGGSVSTAQPYSVTVTRTSAIGCASSQDCAAAYDTQLYRAECVTEGEDAGACVAIERDVPASGGSSCDSGDDCESELCSAFSFTSNADERAQCTSSCSSDDECLSGFVCTDYLLNNMCVPECATDDHCAVLIGNQPSEGETWVHLTCNGDTGKCEFPE